MTTATPTTTAPSHALQCLEIWGGNERVHSAVSVPGLDAWITSQPAGDAAQGGDLHYISMCGEGRISRFAIADVSGHGDEAGTMARTLRRLMRQHIYRPDQSRFAQALNREFLHHASNGRFATALLATYFAPTDQLIVCNAGHPRPLWYQAASHRWLLLDERSARAAVVAAQPRELPRNLPLGIIYPTDYVQFVADLSQGDLLLIYTDGIVEATDTRGRLFGEEGLLRLVHSLNSGCPEHLIDQVFQAVNQFCDGPANDDQTLLVLHHNAADPPKQSIGAKLLVMAKMLGFGGDR